MRTIILAAMCGLTTSIVGAAEPRPLPIGTESKLEHLKAAAEHLKAVGLIDEAEKLENDAEAFRDSTTKSLEQKRQQASALLSEIRELERDLGLVRSVQVSVCALELDATALPEIRAAAGLEPDAPLVTLTARQRHEVDLVLQRLEREHKAKVHAETMLVTNDGRPATMLAGGQCPIFTPGKGDSLSVTYKEIGTRLEMLPQTLDANRLKLDVAYEETHKDMSSAVTLYGQVVPGMTVRRVNTQVEIDFGETAVCGGFYISREQQNSNATEKVVRRRPSTTVNLASGEIVEESEQPATDRVHLVLATPDSVKPPAATPAKH